MDYITNGIHNLYFGNTESNQKVNKFTVVVKFNDQTYEYNGNSNEQTIKLYYIILSQIDKISQYNNFKTVISLEGNNKQTYQIITFKKLFY